MASPGLDVFEEGSPSPQHIPSDFCPLYAGHRDVSSYHSNCCWAGAGGAAARDGEEVRGKGEGRGEGGRREDEKEEKEDSEGEEK